MPILNNIAYRITNTQLIVVHKSRTQSILSRYNFKNKLYWYVEIESIHSFNKELWLEALPYNIIKLIQQNKIFLVISNFLEGTISIVEPLYQLVVLDLALPEEQIMLVTGARDITKEIDIVSSKFKKKHINAFWSYDHEYIMNFHEKQNSRFAINNGNYNFSKKFINLNRRWRVHRPTFVALLIIHDILKYGHVSLVESEESDDTWEKSWELMVHNHEIFAQDLNNHKNLIVNTTPLITDTVDDSLKNNWHVNSLRKLYDSTYFTVVSETNYYYPESRFLTEKTLLPIVHGHPFILLARPFTLELLKERGYKTFSPFIDETYDNETDDAKRMQMVLRETERLCNLNTIDLKKFIDGCKEICIFNYKNLTENIKPYIKLN